jgi:hypothetical protein
MLSIINFDLHIKRSPPRQNHHSLELIKQHAGDTPKCSANVTLSMLLDYSTAGGTYRPAQMHSIDQAAR